MVDLLKKDEHEAHTLLTVKEVREIFGIARSTVYRWIDRCWLRKAGQVQAPESHKNQKVALLELADEDLQDQFEAWVRAERRLGHSPHFFVEGLARIDPLPAEEVDPRDESKQLVGELDELMGRLDLESEERDRLVDALDSAPAIEASGLRQAERGLKEIVDLLKEISNREDELREDSVELPKELDIPPHARESEDFLSELGEERGQGLEPRAQEKRKTEEGLWEETLPEGDPPEKRQTEEGLWEETLHEDEATSIYVDRDAVEKAREQDSLEFLDEEEMAEFAFLADPETLGEEGEWIELNIDEGENPLLKEELVALDESFLPGAPRRGIKIDFNKGVLSEPELDELSVAEEAASDLQEEDAQTSVPQDEENDSWLGISLPAEEMIPEEQAQVPYDASQDSACDASADFLEGEELRLLHASVEDGDAEGFYLDGEKLESKDRSDDEEMASEVAEIPGAEAEILELELLPMDEGWATALDEESGLGFHDDTGALDVEFEEERLEEQCSESEEPAESEGGTAKRMPEEIEPETGISEAMLTGEDAVHLEPDEEVLEIEEAFEAEDTEDFEEILAEVDATADPVSEEHSTSEEDATSGGHPLSKEDEEEAVQLDDLEGETLLSLEDLDEDLDVAVEIEVDEEDPLSLEDISIEIEEADDNQDCDEASFNEEVEVDAPAETEAADEPVIEEEPEVNEPVEAELPDEPVIEKELEVDVPAKAELPDEPVIEEEPEVEVSAKEELDPPAAPDPVQEEESVPAAAMQGSEPILDHVALPSTADSALSKETLESSAEMIKEGMIGIRLSILEVKEGLGILQDPVDSVSQNTAKVSEGVLEIANEARETRRTLEELGARLVNLDLSSLRSSASGGMKAEGALVTGIGLALLVVTWCLGLYLRSAGNAMSLYVVFGANLLITFAILMLRNPRPALDE